MIRVCRSPLDSSGLPAECDVFTCGSVVPPDGDCLKWTPSSRQIVP
ncbi:MAG: hypothetical protein GY894_06625 [Planctomycetes bacterium]|nr:hypothetical protein [Planctomycetota bacterium]